MIAISARSPSLMGETAGAELHGHCIAALTLDYS
jgi:hypothetical protein